MVSIFNQTLRRAVMKKIVSFILAAVLALSFAVPVCAKDTVTYTDSDSGNTLSIPSGWSVSTNVKAPLKAKFSVSSGSSAMMNYGSIDIWKSLSDAAKKKLPRANCDNSAFSKAEIADLIGTEAKNLKTKTIGGREYFYGETEKTVKSGNLSLSMTVSTWVYVNNGWLYLYQFGGGSGHSLYKDFTSLISSATYGTSGSATGGSSDSSVYADAVSAYNRGNYSTARKLFSSIEGYQDSSKYLRLLRIRASGSNPGMGGAVYSSSCGLTASQQSDIDAAARDFYFADTAQVLLCNSDVACYYLLGKWTGGSKCYIEFYENKKAGYSYYIGSKLSTNYQSTYSIQDGDLRVDILGSNKLTLSLTLTAPNCMEVYSHEKGHCYTLNRK